MIKEIDNAHATDLSAIDEFAIEIIFPDEKKSFSSPQDFLIWLKDDKESFQRLIKFDAMQDNESFNGKKELSEFIDILKQSYNNWYDDSLRIGNEMNSISRFREIDKDALKKLHEDLKKVCNEFFDAGMVPMQSSIGRYALFISSIKNNPRDFPPLPKYPLGLAWLHAMTTLRKQQLEQKIHVVDFREKFSENNASIEALEKRIKNTQDNLGQYEEDIKNFKENILKSAALQSPADTLDHLKHLHKRNAFLYFFCGIFLSVFWGATMVCYFYPHLIEIAKASEDILLGRGSVIFMSMTYTGLFAALIVAILRLAVSRVNFCVAAEERSAMAKAYRALLNENALSESQQMIFLQNIVGTKSDNFVQCNNIRSPAEEISKIINGNAKMQK